MIEISNSKRLDIRDYHFRVLEGAIAISEKFKKRFGIIGDIHKNPNEHVQLAVAIEVTHDKMRRPSTVVRRRVEADGGPLGESAVPVSKKCSQRLIAGIRKRARLLPSNHKIQLAVIVKVTHAYNALGGRSGRDHRRGKSSVTMVFGVNERRGPARKY